MHTLLYMHSLYLISLIVSMNDDRIASIRVEDKGVEPLTPCLQSRCSSQLSYGTISRETPLYKKITGIREKRTQINLSLSNHTLQKGGVPAAPSGTATLLRLSPSHQFCPRSLLAVTNFRHPRLPWLDGRCVQGPGTYSPRHG